MAASRVIASGVRCGACRSRFLRTFVPLAGFDSAPALGRARATTRAFTSAPLRLSDNLTKNEPSLDSAESNTESAPASADSQEASVPWYLQVDAPQQPLDGSAHPLADRQRIPALPEHPPPILEHLLRYVSVDLGIDDVSLLDLRELDPPPALGANLLMLFGTTRSEKHLHVSADRLCRWLRSEYKLSPYADGLLGRNELKLKLRRKARKARMLSNAGGSESSLAADDGIQSSWICVNVGSVKAAESTPTDGPKIQNFVGFGGVSKGVNIVLQLFTEEKRTELDLETMWNGVLKTDRRRKEASTTNDAPVDEMYNPNGAVFAGSNVPKSSSAFQHTNPQAPLQTRALHTTRMKEIGTRLVSERAGKQTLANNLTRPWRASMSTASDAGRSSFKSFTPSSVQEPAGPSQHGEALGLAKKLEQLRQMSKEEKKAALGTGFNSRMNGVSTPFLKEFNSYIPEFPDVVHYEAIMQLYLVARSINHPGYPVFLINDLLWEMISAGIRVPERMFLDTLRSNLSVEHPEEFEESTAQRRNQIVFAFLQAMQGQSYSVLTDEIILMLHNSVSTLTEDLEAQHPEQSTVIKRAEYNRSVRHKLLHQIDVLGIPLKHETFAHLLQSYARLGDMEGMWHVWSSTALSMYSRSAYMYAVALNGVAFSGSQKGCIEALRNCLATMKQEIPEVELKGDVRDAVMRCLLVISPEIDKAWERGNKKGEWLSIWNRCMRELGKEEERRRMSRRKGVPQRSLSGRHAFGQL